jgi:hypothetical protein
MAGPSIGQYAEIEMQLISYTKVTQEIFNKVPETERKPLLIATFLNSTNPRSVKNLHDNIEFFREKATFAVVVYDGTSVSIHSACHASTSIASGIVHCRKATITYTNAYRSYPKPVLYPDLLPLLPYYRRALLIDEDISLREINLKEFLRIWDCAFWPAHPPLVVQGLVYENTQNIKYVEWDYWKKNENSSSVIAAKSKFIEQQIPAFDSHFLYWFIDYVLAQWHEQYLHYQTDWGIDGLWCGAGFHFAHQVYGVPLNDSQFAPCALITGTQPFHHLNGHTLKAKSHNHQKFWADSLEFMELWKGYFTGWWMRTNTSKALGITDHRWVYSLDSKCPVSEI